MENNTPPDFEKLALEMADECKDGNHIFDCVCSAREEGMEKIWNDYVLPEKQKTDELLKWKESEMQVWGPLIEYFQHEDKLIKPGDSISKEALRRSKAFGELLEALDQLRMWVESCDYAPDEYMVAKNLITKHSKPVSNEKA